MATRLLSLGGTGKPFSPGRLAVALGRVLTIVVAVVLIDLTRESKQVDAGLILSFAAFGAIYLVFGRRGEMRGPVLYIIFTSAVAQLRMFGDQTGIPVHYEYVYKLDTFLFGGVLPNHWLQSHLYQAHVVTPLVIYAAVIYLSFFLMFWAPIVVWICNRSFFSRYATAAVIATTIGIIGCYTLPTAPPWMAARDGHAPAVHRVMEELSNKVDSSAYSDGTKVAGDNQVAAMPSVHIAISVLAMLTIWHFSRKRLIRLLGLLYVGSMSFALLFLGEHYVTDELAGVLTAAIAWTISMRLWSADGARLLLPAMPWSKRAEGLEPVRT